MKKEGKALLTFILKAELNYHIYKIKKNENSKN